MTRFSRLAIILLLALPACVNPARIDLASLKTLADLKDAFGEPVRETPMPGDPAKRFVIFHLPVFVEADSGSHYIYRYYTPEHCVRAVVDEKDAVLSALRTYPPC